MGPQQPCGCSPCKAPGPWLGVEVAVIEKVSGGTYEVGASGRISIQELRAKPGLMVLQPQ